MFTIYQYEKSDKQIDFSECLPTEGQAIDATTRYFEEDDEVSS